MIAKGLREIRDAIINGNKDDYKNYVPYTPEAYWSVSDKDYPIPVRWTDGVLVYCHLRGDEQ